jgi:hypothetical protein
LLPGTELAFEKEVQCDAGFVFHSRRQLGHRVAKFRQINNGQPNVHHDALEFPDGHIVLLTQLCEGQHATVLQLPASPLVTTDEVRRHDSLAVWLAIASRLVARHLQATAGVRRSAVPRSETGTTRKLPAVSRRAAFDRFPDHIGTSLGTAAYDP